jgi:effector-binding domain-containing protein
MGIKILCAMGTLLAILLLLVLIAPKQLEMERTVLIEATADQVFPHLKFFEKRKAWSPWHPLDPNIKTSIEGIDGEVRAISKWSGNDKVGEGQEVIESIVPNQEVVTKTIFIKPWKSEAGAVISLAPEGDKTKVSWGFKMDLKIPFNVMGLFMDMSKSIAADYDRGLANLKKLVEAEAAAINAGNAPLVVEELDLPATQYIGIRLTAPFTELEAKSKAAMTKLQDALKAKSISPSGPPRSLFYVWDMEKQQSEMMVTAPVAAKADLGPGFEYVSFPASKGLKVAYYGEYGGTGAAHGALDEYANKKGLKIKTPVIEEYYTDPSTQADPKKWLTNVLYMLE